MVLGINRLLRHRRGLTLLIRPNLVLLALAPVFAWQEKRETLIRYAMGIVPGLLAIAVIRASLPADRCRPAMDRRSNPRVSSVPSNLRNYIVWMVQTQTPFILLALCPAVRAGALRENSPTASTRACLGAFIVLTFFSYLFYATFNNWFYLRFLLPAYPALLVRAAPVVASPGEFLVARARSGCRLRGRDSVWD